MTRLFSKQLMKQVIGDLRAAGYEVIEDETTYIVNCDGYEVLRAMAHSSGKNYLVRYDDQLLTEA